MVPTSPHKPRVGIPWRTTQEERQGIREKLDFYFASVRRAGGEPVEVSLGLPLPKLRDRIAELDAFVLPGSPADVDPARYGKARHEKTGLIDAGRDSTDSAILDHALASGKPVLAICYGCQILNVHQNGTLLQDIRDERPDSAAHGTTDLPPGSPRSDLEHEARLEPGSLLAALNRGTAAHVNSSHHQAIDAPGQELRVTARAADGLVEAVEWAGDGNWVVGVQWHPERMPEDRLAQELFSSFISAASRARHAVGQKP